MYTTHPGPEETIVVSLPEITPVNADVFTKIVCMVEHQFIKIQVLVLITATLNSKLNVPHHSDRTKASMNKDNKEPAKRQRRLKK